MIFSRKTRLHCFSPFFPESAEVNDTKFRPKWARNGLFHQSAERPVGWSGLISGIEKGTSSGSGCSKAGPGCTSGGGSPRIARAANPRTTPATISVSRVCQNDFFIPKVFLNFCGLSPPMTGRISKLKGKIQPDRSAATWYRETIPVHWFVSVSRAVVFLFKYAGALSE